MCPKKHFAYLVSKPLPLPPERSKTARSVPLPRNRRLHSTPRQPEPAPSLRALSGASMLERSSLRLKCLDRRLVTCNIWTTTVHQHLPARNDLEYHRRTRAIFRRSWRPRAHRQGLDMARQRQCNLSHSARILRFTMSRMSNLCMAPSIAQMMRYCRKNTMPSWMRLVPYDSCQSTITRHRSTKSPSIP